MTDLPFPAFTPCQAVVTQPGPEGTAVQGSQDPADLSWGNAVFLGLFNNVCRCLGLSQFGRGRGGCYGIQWVEARDAIIHPAVHRAAPSPKQQFRQGWETCPVGGWPQRTLKEAIGSG